jgi:RNA polymerase sigma factor (sigma-70 family)
VRNSPSPTAQYSGVEDDELLDDQLTVGETLLAPEETGPHARAVAAQLREILDAAAVVLEPTEARLLELVYGDGYSIRQTAFRLGIAVWTAERIHQHCLAALRTALEARGVTSPEQIL